MFVPFVVLAPPAVYVFGSVISISPVPNANVNFLEFEVPETVIEPPVFDADTLLIDTNSGFASCVIACEISVTPVALYVAVPERWLLPV
jgi:hypothetical protein